MGWFLFDAKVWNWAIFGNNTYKKSSLVGTTGFLTVLTYLLSTVAGGEILKLQIHCNFHTLNFLFIDFYKVYKNKQKSKTKGITSWNCWLLPLHFVEMTFYLQKSASPIDITGFYMYRGYIGSSDMAFTYRFGKKL